MPSLSQSMGNSFRTRLDLHINSSRTFSHELFPLLPVKHGDLNQSDPKIIVYSKYTKQIKSVSPFKSETQINKKPSEINSLNSWIRYYHRQKFDLEFNN